MMADKVVFPTIMSAIKSPDTNASSLAVKSMLLVSAGVNELSGEEFSPVRRRRLGDKPPVLLEGLRAESKGAGVSSSLRLGLDSGNEIFSVVFRSCEGDTLVGVGGTL